MIVGDRKFSTPLSSCGIIVGGFKGHMVGLHLLHRSEFQAGRAAGKSASHRVDWSIDLHILWLGALLCSTAPLQGRLGICSTAGHITASNKSRGPLQLRRKGDRILEGHPMEPVQASVGGRERGKGLRGKASVGRASEPVSCCR